MRKTANNGRHAAQNSPESSRSPVGEEMDTYGAF
ncbi:hypothetical protein [Clostridium phage Saumur]|nr:hypothetical protein [Clostridium phage Saumur]